jgi:NAD(P)H dehydrogenase (quinone)
MEFVMKIGVSGASGNIGKQVIERLSAQLTPDGLVAISRTPQTIGSVEGRVGDYDRPETLVQAYSGLDRLLIIPSANLRYGVRSAQGIAAIDAAVAAGVKAVYLLSACGTRQKQEPSMGAAYWQSEQRLIKSGIASWTILRMNYFSETLVEEARMSFDRGALPGIAENKVAFVSRDDVAAAAAAALTTDGHAGAIYNLTGPESLSGAERTEAISKAVGKPYGYAVFIEEQLRSGLAGAGLPDFLIDAVVSMKASQAEGAFDIVTGDVEKLVGRAPKPLVDVLDEAFAR